MEILFKNTHANVLRKEYGQFLKVYFLAVNLAEVQINNGLFAIKLFRIVTIIAT